MAEIDTIKQKLVKLSNMTIENGATESEAMIAASKMAEILDANGMTHEELSIYQTQSEENKKEKIEFGAMGSKGMLHEIQYAAVAIAKYFDCRVISSTVTSRFERKRLIKFFGFANDVQACLSLAETITMAMESDFRRYMVDRQVNVHGKTLRKAFMLGFTGRVSSRLNSMKADRTAQKNTGNALVVLKTDLVTKSFNSLNYNLKAAPKTRYNSNAHAYSAGASAGDNANLGPQYKKIA